MKAFIIHISEGWHNDGSLLLLFKEFGYKTWLKPHDIVNYTDLNFYSPQLEQEIIVSANISEMIRIGIYHKKGELLKYKKGARI